jgi:hypothetical protein
VSAFGHDAKGNIMLRTVIVFTNLLLVLVLGMEDNVGDELEKDVAEEFRSEDHFREVVAVLQGFEHVAWHDVSRRVRDGIVPDGPLISIFCAKYAS